MDSSTWLKKLGRNMPTFERWHVEIVLGVAQARPPTDFDEAVATRFHLNIYSEEWGIYFCHAGRSSWIRVTDIAFVHGRDDYGLLTLTPPLKDIGSLIRRLEQKHSIRFQREQVAIKTNVASIEPAIRAWVARL